MKITTTALLLCAALLGGCATHNRNPHDPLEPFNREVSKFNEGVDAVVLKPVATAYQQHVPALVRTGVSNFFGNLGDLWSAVNSVLQLKIGNAAENAMRFQVNTIFGVAGIFDVASELNIERHKEDFGQTLGRWGVPAGPYIVIPFLGPSTLRDTVALPVDRRYDLVHYIDPDSTRHALYGVRAVDTRANLLRVSDVLEGAALDKYSFTRDAFLQKRRAEIYGDKPDPDGGKVDDPERAGQPAPAPKR